MTSKLETLTQKNYLSYSSMNTYLECGERFRLERVLGAPQQKAWYFIGGDAVHTATERLDKGQIDNPATAWAEAWAQSLDTVNPGEVIRSSGRKTKDWPDKENRDWWEHHGPQFVASWVTWRDARLAEGWHILDPGIEVPVEFQAHDVLVKGYIDRVMVDPNGQVTVIDLKTGSREPSSSLQLAVYALGLERSHGYGAGLGGYWMARQGDVPTFHSLLHLTDGLVARWFADTKKAIEEEIFIPKVGPLCTACSVAPFCSAVGGDPSSLGR